MIINLSRSQKEIAVAIVEPGCSGGQILNFTQFRLSIRRPEDDGCWMNNSPILRLGCWPGVPEYIDPAFQTPHPEIIYPAFTTDNDGNIVFKLDRKMDFLRPGRYQGCIERQTGECWVTVRCLDIDLENMPTLATRVTVSDSDSIQGLCD